MLILRQKTTVSASRIETLIKTDEGVFLLKTRGFEDNTATSRFYKISFDDFGEIECMDTYGKVYESDIESKNSLQLIHDCAFFKVQEQYTQLIKED